MRRSSQPGLIPPGSPYRILVNSKVSSLGTPAAVMVQIANGAIAASLVEKGGMKADPTGRVSRVLLFSMAIAMGTGPQGREAIQAIRDAHVGVKGAYNPALQRLVWATLVDKQVAALRRYGPGFTDDQAEEAWAHSSPIQVQVGLPVDEQHKSFAEVQAFVAQEEARLKITADSLDLASMVMSPSIALLKPLGPLIRHTTAELLSQRLADAYGLEAGRHHEFEHLITTSGRLLGPLAGNAIYQEIAGRYAGHKLAKMFVSEPSLA